MIKPLAAGAHGAIPVFLISLLLAGSVSGDEFDCSYIGGDDGSRYTCTHSLSGIQLELVRGGSLAGPATHLSADGPILAPEARMERISPFLISLTEVTRDQFLRWKGASSWRQVVRCPKKCGEEAVSEVTALEAESFARWLGGRLPTEREWLHVLRSKVGTHEALEEARQSRLFPKLRRVQDLPFSEIDLSVIRDAGNLLEPFSWIPFRRVPVRNGLQGCLNLTKASSDTSRFQGLVGGLWEWTSTAIQTRHSEEWRAVVGSSSFDTPIPGAPLQVLGAEAARRRSPSIGFRVLLPLAALRERL